MNKGAFMSKNMDKLKEDYPDLYECSEFLNDTVYNGKSLDKKTLKLIAVAIAASSNNDAAIYKQIKNAVNSYDVSKDEIMDSLRIVLMMSGKPAFTKSVGILYDVLNE